MGRPLLLPAMLAFAASCGPPSERAKIEMEPIGTIDPSKLPPKEKSGDTPEAAPAKSAVPLTAKETPSSGSSGSSGSGVPLSAEPTVPSAERRNEECSGGRFDNLYLLLTNKTCEVDARADTAQNVKDALEVKVTSSTPQIVPGGRVDILITYRNKSSKPLNLTFVLDPSPRFDTDVYDRSGKLVGINAPTPPKPKKAPPTPPRTWSRITLTPNGIAKMKTGWTASSFRWATEQLKNGVIPDSGYPKVATGPMPKGNYVLRLVTPLVLVTESADKELSSPRIPVEVSD